MAGRIKPKSETKNKTLASMVDKGVTTKIYDNENMVRESKAYRIGTDYIRDVELLSTGLKKKKYEVVEEALELYFQQHKDLLDKLRETTNA